MWFRDGRPPSPKKTLKRRKGGKVKKETNRAQLGLVVPANPGNRFFALQEKNEKRLSKGEKGIGGIRRKTL